jgi:hypothetical protein
MTKPQTQKEQIDCLIKRVNQFFNIYGNELESISQILKIRLGGLALAYTAENKLPREAVFVHAYFYWRSHLQSMATISDR